MDRATTDVPAAEPFFGPSDVASLRRSLRGRLVVPSDDGYAQARSAWNGMVDKRPSAIAYCNNPDDVIAAVTFARSRTIPLSVRAGGHNVAGCCVCDNGLVIDVSQMKDVWVDAARRTARAEAGLTLGEFDAATQRVDLATTMGVNSDTGIAGLTLGGGFGKLGRKHGLTCDNLIAADIVIADGRMVRASQEENPDLFWGIRGGGGNFGIATAFEYRLHPVGPTIAKASLAYDVAHARDALRAYYEFSSAASDEISADAALVRSPGGEPIFTFSICYLGPATDGEQTVARAVEQLKRKVPPLDESIVAVPYLEIQSAADSLFQRGRRYYWKAQFLRELTDAAIDALLEAYIKAPSPSSLVVLQQVGGAIARVPTTQTAYGQRDAAYDCFPIAIWDNPADDEANMRWARDFWAAVRPFSTGGVYVNNLGDEGQDRVRAAYGENYGRLVALKRKYDPTNFFRLNQNIDPEAKTG
jgi:FAD/FMN-containing dehydrogenase